MQAPRRLKSANRASWDKRPEPRWRRVGPKAVVARSRRRLVAGILWAALSLSAGIGMGAIFARWAGII